MILTLTSDNVNELKPSSKSIRVWFLSNIALIAEPIGASNLLLDKFSDNNVVLNSRFAISSITPGLSSPSAVS
jgi:hypothetical protein